MGDSFSEPYSVLHHDTSFETLYLGQLSRGGGGGGGGGGVRESTGWKCVVFALSPLTKRLRVSCNYSFNNDSAKFVTHRPQLALVEQKK